MADPIVCPRCGSRRELVEAIIEKAPKLMSLNPQMQITGCPVCHLLAFSIDAFHNMNMLAEKLDEQRAHIQELEALVYEDVAPPKWAHELAAEAVEEVETILAEGE